MSIVITADYHRTSRPGPANPELWYVEVSTTTLSGWITGANRFSSFLKGRPTDPNKPNESFHEKVKRSLVKPIQRYCRSCNVRVPGEAEILHALTEHINSGTIIFKYAPPDLPLLKFGYVGFPIASKNKKMETWVKGELTHRPGVVLVPNLQYSPSYFDGLASQWGIKINKQEANSIFKFSSEPVLPGLEIDPNKLLLEIRHYIQDMDKILVFGDKRTRTELFYKHSIPTVKVVEIK